LRMNGMVDRNGSFVLWQSSDGVDFIESVTLTTTDTNVSIQSFNGTPGYYYYYVVTKTLGANCKANAYNNVIDGLLGDFSPGPINGVTNCGDNTTTSPTFQLPDPRQTRSYISFNGSLDGGCL
jgi:hypothetical protein